MKELKERLEKYRDTSSDEYSDLYQADAFEVGFNKLLPIVLELAEALKFLTEREPKNGSQGRACTFCDMGGAGYSIDGLGHHDDVKHVCPVSVADKALAKLDEMIKG